MRFIRLGRQAAAVRAVLKAKPGSKVAVLADGTVALTV